jgi:NADH-quinone oxidoreductase subunit A
MFGFVEMLLFVALIFPGFIYLWRKGVFDWSQNDRDDWEDVAPQHTLPEGP